MKFIYITFTALVLSCTIEANEELAKKSSCFACHRTESQLVGPAFKQIAEKYKDQQRNTESLFESIKNGSTGKWGAIPMPANDSVSDEEINALVTWILSL